MEVWKYRLESLGKEACMGESDIGGNFAYERAEEHVRSYPKSLRGVPRNINEELLCL